MRDLSHRSQSESLHVHNSVSDLLLRPGPTIHTFARLSVCVSIFFTHTPLTFVGTYEHPPDSRNNVRIFRSPNGNRNSHRHQIEHQHRKCCKTISNEFPPLAIPLRLFNPCDPPKFNPKGPWPEILAWLTRWDTP
jgi:hypothetical protein